MSNPLKLVAPENVPFVHSEREFDYPAAAVFRAHSDPEVFRQWIGPRELSTRIDVFDCRPGGTYRFVQEGLNNAYRHAGGHGQTVECRHEGDVFVLRVSDDGGGTAGRPETSEGSLGLFGLRGRVESLGGTFSVRHGRQGTVIEMATVLNGGDEV